MQLLFDDSFTFGSVESWFDEDLGPAATPPPILGSRLVALYGEDYAGGLLTPDYGAIDYSLADVGAPATPTATPAGNDTYTLVAGSSGFAGLPNDTIAGAVLVACVFRTSGVATDAIVFGVYSSLGQYSAIAIAPTGELAALHGVFVAATTTSTWDDGQWHYAVLRGSVATMDVELWVDGALEATGTGTGTPALAAQFVIAGYDLALSSLVYSGEVGRMVLAVDSSADWTSGDIDEVNDYLQAWIGASSNVVDPVGMLGIFGI